MKINKKLSYFLIVIMLVALSSVFVSAKEVDVTILSIEEVEKSKNTVVEAAPTIVDGKLVSNVKFFDVGDYVKYKLTLKNNGEDNFYIENIIDNNGIRNVSYEYEFDEPMIEAKGQGIVYLKVSYSELLAADNPLDANDVYSVTNQVNLKVNLSDAPATFTNPETLNNLLLMGFFIVFFGVSVYFVIKYKKRSMMALFLLSVFLVRPFLVFADEEQITEVQINTDLKIQASVINSNWKNLVSGSFDKIELLKVENDVDGSVDISKLGDRSVFAWIEDNTLKIASKYQIFAPINSTGLFSDLGVSSINFNKRLDTAYVTNMNNMFYNDSNLTSLDLSSFDTSGVNSYDGLVGYCLNLTDLNLSGFDFSRYAIDTSDEKGLIYNLTNNSDSITSLNLEWSKFSPNMSYAFSNMGNINLNLKNVNSSATTNMAYMFASSSFTNLDLSSFNTSNVTSMERMFYNCKDLTSVNLSSFDVSNVSNFNYMFADARGFTSLDLSNFRDIKDSITTLGMFNKCTNLDDLNLVNFDFSKVSNEASTSMFTQVKTTCVVHVKDEANKNRLKEIAPLFSVDNIVIG